MTRSGSLTKLQRSFYIRPTETVAKELLGKYLVRVLPQGKLIGMIVEVEAYLGANDPASHTYNGKTKRNEVMFKKGGHLYVYFTYGMHFCSNVVTEEEGVGHAVLIRAIEPLAGIEIMQGFRNTPGKNGTEKNLTNGPARLCQAYAIARNENGTDLLGNVFFITKGVSIKPSQIISTTRIGIQKAKEELLRFYLKDNVWVSKK